MLLIDVNPLVYAHRRGTVEHDRYADWFANLAVGEPFSVPDVVLTAVVRLVTNSRVFGATAATTEQALAFAEDVRRAPAFRHVDPPPATWATFGSLCRQTGSRGNAIPDAYLAALAIASGSELITADLGFRRFPGLRWRHPLA